jgi:fumarylacetoacetate (FAA) hydrolase family protein
MQDEQSMNLPVDADAAVLVGRAWVPGPLAGPSVVALVAGEVHDLTRLAPTCAELLDAEAPAARIRAAIAGGRAPSLGRADALLANTGPRAVIPRCRISWRPAICRPSGPAA